MNFLDDSTEVAERTEEAKPQDWKNIGGVRIENMRLSAGARRPEVAHPLAAPPGWARYWSPVSRDALYDWKGLEDVIVSGFCKNCFDNKSPCRFGKELSPKCRECICSVKLCLRVISFKIDTESTLRTRTLQRNRLATLGTPLEIPDSALNSEKHAPIWLRHEPNLAKTSKLEGETRQKLDTKRVAPTYSKVRDVYEGLTEIMYQEQCERRLRRGNDSTQRDLEISSHGNFWDRPFGSSPDRFLPYNGIANVYEFGYGDDDSDRECAVRNTRIIPAFAPQSTNYVKENGSYADIMEKGSGADIMEESNDSGNEEESSDSENGVRRV